MAYKQQVALLWLMVSLVAAFGVSSSKLVSHPFTVHGKVYCDTCRCGFETNITAYIPKAVVRIECMPRESGVGGKVMKMYSVEGETDDSGSYSIEVNYDHGDHICDAVLVSSPWKRCSEPDKGRDRSRVILTDLNGVASHYRYSNNLGFLADRAHPSCPRLLDYYLRSQSDHVN